MFWIYNAIVFENLQTYIRVSLDIIVFIINTSILYIYKENT